MFYLTFSKYTDRFQSASDMFVSIFSLFFFLEGGGILCPLTPLTIPVIYTFCRYFHQEAQRNVLHLTPENIGYADNYAFREEYVKCINVMGLYCNC